MFRPRIIPVLLLQNLGLVKSVKFKNYRYIGDPINAVNLFNDLRADELVFLDINASIEGRRISLDFVEKAGDECSMPFAVGGGIKNINDIRVILNAGAEKVVINTSAAINPEFVREASTEFGSSTIVVSMDVQKKKFRKETTYIYSGSKPSGFDPVDFACLMEEKGAGEILIQSIDHDGTMLGYNLELISRISNKVTIPVVACSGAGDLSHLASAYYEANASAAAAGSMFVFHGTRRAVLINYPEKEQLSSLFKTAK
jgi:imidazole glycerol-phosphate synthase subunit HisF